MASLFRKPELLISIQNNYTSGVKPLPHSIILSVDRTGGGGLGERQAVSQRERMAAFRRSPAGRASSEFAAKRAAECAQWLEANRPADKPGTTVRVNNRLRPFTKQSKQDWELQCLTYDHLKNGDCAWLFHPKPESTWRDYAVEALLRRLEEASAQLRRLVLVGDPAALSAFADYVVSNVGFLNRVARDEKLAKGLIPFARQQVAWPCFKSPHRHFFKDEDELLVELEVGQGDPRVIQTHANWDPNDPAGQISLRVWQQIHTWRNENLWLGTVPEWKSRAWKLPPFDTDRAAVLAWYELGKAYIKAHPKEYEPMILKLKIPPSKRPKRGKNSSHAFTMIRDKFLSMGGFKQA